MAATTPFQNLIAIRPQFNAALNFCVAYLRSQGSRTAEQKKLHASLKPLATSLFGASAAPTAANSQRRENLQAIQRIVELLTDISESHDELQRAKDVVDVLTGIVQESFGKELDGFGGAVGFDTISKIKSAFWSRRAKKLSTDNRSSSTHRVIRINDIPFAESVYPALLSRASNDLGYSILVEDVAWSEIGAALYNQKIDVALYNGSLTTQLKSVETLFDRKLLYKSAPLIRYEGYEIIRCSPYAGKIGLGKLGVPWKSDFEEVVKSRLKKGPIRFQRLGATISLNDLVYMPSADEVLEAVVDGKLEFGIVGGLQAEYAAKQFPWLKSSSRTLKIKGQTLNLLPTEKANCAFWVAVQRRDEAVSLLSAMTTLWNELVVRGWEHAINASVNAIQDELVSIVNEHPHRSYVDDFSALRALITKHDVNVGKIIAYECNPVEL